MFGLAEQFNQHRFERVAEDVWHKGLVTPDQAADYLATIRRSGRTGVIRMETWLERIAIRPGDDAGAERVGAGVLHDDRTCGVADPGPSTSARHLGPPS